MPAGYDNENEEDLDWFDDREPDWDECPCDSCLSRDACDGWEAQFCCDLCRYEGRDYCDDCDPWDI